MGVRILEDRESGEAVLCCSVTEWAFGPVFQSVEEAEALIEWLPKDARRYGDSEFVSLYGQFREERTCQHCSGLLEHPLDDNHQEIEDAWQCPDPKCKGRKDPCPSPK